MCSLAQSSWLFEVTAIFRKLSQAKHRIYDDLEGLAEQSMVFAVFTGSVELAFRSHCDFEGLVEQSVIFTVFSKA